MKTRLSVKKCTFGEFEKYSKENDMLWIIKTTERIYKNIDNKYLKKVIGEEYRIEIDPDKEYSFIICGKFSFLIDVDGHVAESIDNDKYDYYVSFNTLFDELGEELRDIVSHDNNVIARINLVEWSYVTRYHLALYYKDTGKLTLSTDNNITSTRIQFTAFRVNKETKEYDKIHFDYRDNKLKISSL